MKRFLLTLFVILVALLIAGVVVIQTTPGQSSAAAGLPRPSGTVTTTVSKPGITLGIGSQGYGVRVVQFWLKGHGFSINVDGDFGLITEKRVKTWQGMNGLAKDGRVGARTLASMGLDASDLVQPSKPAKSRTAPSPKPVTPVTPAAEPADSPTPVVDAGDTESIIRDVWPDDLEDHAVLIAKRESGPHLLVTAHNACCYGNFQINWSAHRAWLANYGVFKPSDLYDPRVNATVALALYNQVGWTPWNCYGQCKDV